MFKPSDTANIKTEEIITMKIKKIIAAGIAAAALLSNTAFASDMYATRGEVASMLLSAADDYNPTIEYSDIIKGYGGDGELHEDWNVNRAEALVMLSRAFGKLPELSGHNARVALKSGDFSDIPDWAMPELKPVLDAGIAAGTADGVFSPYDDVTKEQMQLFINRVYALFGTNEKDDFYAAVNKDKLNSLELKPGRMMSGTLYDLQDDSTEEVNGIIKEAIEKGGEKGGEKGSTEQKISDFYKNILDSESRNKIGIEPIKPCLEKIDSASNVSELATVQTELIKDLCSAPYTAFSITADFKNSTQYIMTFGTFDPYLTKDFYMGATDDQKAVYLKYLKTVMSLADENITDEQLEDFYNFEKSVAAKKLNPEEGGNIDKIYNIYTLDEIQAEFPSIDMNAVLKAQGLKGEDRILVAEKDSAEEFSRWFNDNNIDTLKTAAKLSVALNFGGALNTEFVDAANEFNSELLGISGTYSDEELATIIISGTLPDYIGELYAEKYFSEDAKQDVLKMVRDIISVYKSRIQNLDWMSAATKEKAIKKLDSMNIKIGYPDKSESWLDNVEIKSKADGGSYFDNILAVSKAAAKHTAELQGTAVDKTKWLMYPYTVNACYSATSNDITFPAAILQPPMYDINASYEENLGAIGYVIAHEITHAFDNNGAKFDENGNAADWWTAEDYAEFEKRCEKTVYFYDRQEGIPGVPMNGRQTLSENVSDQGAVQCITEVASKLENPDYQKLYRSMANAWASTKTREYAKYIRGIDVHSEDKLRVNRVVVNCDEFYRAFGIIEKDGMWTAPEDRIKIW